jgi:hypothetical protein
MMSEHMGAVVEVWPVAADEIGIWLASAATPGVPHESPPTPSRTLRLSLYSSPRAWPMRASCIPPAGASTARRSS